MKNIFFKMYGSAIIGALVIAIIIYVLLGLINKHRYEAYLNQTVGGTFSLMAAGIGRHHGEKQQQWIDVVERLTGLILKKGPLDNIKDFTHYKLPDDQQEVLIDSDLSTKSALIALAIPESVNEFVVTEIRDINQTMTRVTALLILNELGRHQKTDRERVLAELNQDFSYEVSLVEKDELTLDEAQWRQLSRGDIVINLSESSSGKLELYAYARYGNSGLLLSLGPIATFQWYPITLILPLVLIAAMLFLVFSYSLVHALEKKLHVLEEGIKKAGTSEAQVISLSGNDGFARMALSVNDMMSRIDFLVEQQRQLTHDISHELRTPIARIMFRVENLVDEKEVEPNKHIVGIKKDLGSLNLMIDEILTSAKLDYAQHITRQEFNVISLLNDLLVDLEIQYPKVTFSLQSNDDVSLIYADQTLLTRAIENLLINACRHCLANVSIRLVNDKRSLILIIEDDGEGVPSEHRKRVFDPFVRIDESRNRSLGGFGLGLSIVKKIVVLHGGNVAVGESSVYGGALFRITLPESIN